MLADLLKNLQKRNDKTASELSRQSKKDVPVEPLYLRIETMGGKEKRITVNKIIDDCLVCINQNSKREVIIPISAIAEFTEINKEEQAR